jgi:hypothetical protein
MEVHTFGVAWWCCSIVESSMKALDRAAVMSVLLASFGWWVWKFGSVVWWWVWHTVGL